MKYISFTAILLIGLITPVWAQIDVPPWSPQFTVSGTIGFCEVSVEYSRPSARNRQVAGNLIPFGEVWRTGANASTKITFSEDVLVEGNPVPAGKYALYTIFNEEVATIILSKNLDWWGSLGYDKSYDQLRFDVKVKHPSSHYETLTMSFSDFTRNSANLNMKWEHTKAMFKIESDIDSRIMEQINEQVVSGTPDKLNAYLQAANYYYDTDRDLDMALKWINYYIEGSENDQYWVFHSKAKILHKMGNHKESIKAAEKSIELAEKGGNPDYVRLNQVLIQKMK